MTKPVLVMKFGGTSVGSPDAIARAARLVAEHASSYQLAVVVSAMSQVTNRLLATLEAGSNGDEEAVRKGVAELRKSHVDACRELLPSDRWTAILERMDPILGSFERLARGMSLLMERPPAAVDQAAPTGERLSALLMCEALKAMGVESETVSGDSIIVTDAVFGGASPSLNATAGKAESNLRPVLAAGRVAVITGFNAATPDGTPTTLGRGGSDYSAAIVANVLRAEELWIWTDVDGILSCDPSIADDAQRLEEVTFNEAAELSYNGAKVLHPRTLEPLADLGIPVRIKNSFNPSGPGTRISRRPATSRGVRAITSLASVSLISIEAVSLSMSGAQLMARALAAAARARVEVLLLSRSSFRQNFCMLVHTAEVDAVLEGLRDELALELAHGYLQPIGVDHSVGLVAAVGEGMRGTPGLAGRLFTAISRRKVNIIAIAQGSSELTIAIVVDESDLRTAVSAIHRECGLGSRRGAVA